METKPLLFGLIGFMAGGLLVSVAATTFDKPTPDHMAMSQEVKTLETKQGDDYDKAFIESMIMHHQSALDMAKLSEGRSNRAEVKNMSQSIVTSQQAEINQMKQWKAEWFGENHPGH